MTAFNPIEYLSVLKRRAFLFFFIFATISIVSFFIALDWSKYKVSATVEVANPEIAMDTVETSGTQAMSAEAMADLQISRLKQNVLSTGSLAEVIAKLNLYPGERKQTPIAYVAQNMRKKIDIRLISTALANPASAQKATALQLSAIAFVLSFEYSDPVLAQKTVNELISRFLDEDMKERRETAQKTSDFLDGQIEILTASLEDQEKKIAAFTEKHGNVRPDTLSFNQQASVTTTSRLLSIESDIISNMGLIGALRAQLAQTGPYSRVVDESGEVLTTPDIQLRALKSQYATLTAKYGPRHPDVLKVSRQVEALEKKAEPVNLVARLKPKIEDVKARLDTQKDAYGPEHPDVISLQNQLAYLEKKLADAETAETPGYFGLVKEDADNPAYLQIVAQLEAAEKQKDALETQREEVKRQQEEYKSAITSNPAVQQQLASLTRDYENMTVLYRELKAKKLSADMNKTIEEGHIGRRLAVIDPPELPLSTTPSRKMILFAGVALALMTALGSVLALQILSQSVIGPRHLESLIGVAPLVTIPHLRTLDQKIILRRRIIKLVAIAPLAAGLVLLLFFLTIMPFDVFQEVLKRKIGL